MGRRRVPKRMQKRTSKGEDGVRVKKGESPWAYKTRLEPSRCGAPPIQMH